MFSKLVQIDCNKPWLWALAVTGITFASLSLWKQVTRPKWQRVGTLDQLWIYPLKSGKGISLCSANLQKMGLTAGLFKDRQFCIISSE